MTEIIQKLNQWYPGKKVLRLPEDTPTEIICEVEPSVDHPNWSEIVAVIKKSQPHYHTISTEVYKIKEGQLILHIENETLVMNPGDTYTIRPNQVHWAEATDWAWISATSKPGWVPTDHIFVPEGENHD